MSNYKKDILELNYCLYSSLAATVLIRDDCAMALNPRNPVHQQSNLCYRIRLSDEADLDQFVNETSSIFNNVSCQPRYHVDEFSKPSLESICNGFTKLGYENIEIDTDLIMSWERTSEALQLNKDNNTRMATIDDLEEVTNVFAASYGYNQDNIDWLRYKIKAQIAKSDTFQVFVTTTDEYIIITSAVILHTPLGLPHLGHVNSIATHPDYQRKGYAAKCLTYALESTCKQAQKFYLETYDDLYHAHRMYERIGFKPEGLLRSSMIAANGN